MVRILSMVVAVILAAVIMVVLVSQGRHGLSRGAGSDHAAGTRQSAPRLPETIAAIDPRRAFIQPVARHWLAAAVTPNGFYRPFLDRQWQPRHDQYATLVSQSRLIYVFATSYRMTGDPAYRAAVITGADFLLAKFRDPGTGAWRASVWPDGRIRDASETGYGVAAVIFGLCAAHQATGDSRYLDAAAATAIGNAEPMLLLPRLAVRDELALVENTGITVNTNALMHLLEALLALHAETQGPLVAEDAAAIARFAVKDLMPRSGGFIAENYYENLRPGDSIDFGHQLEWAFLLSRAVEDGIIPPVFLPAIEDLADKTLLVALDPAGGLFGTGRTMTASVTGTDKLWWRQAELLRALAHFAAVRGKKDYWPLFRTTRAFVQAHLEDPGHGGWYSEPTAASRDKGNAAKVGYHEAGLYAELERLKALRP